MRHQKKIKKLGRTAAHRKATLAAMGSALIEHKRIETTLPKAKALRSFIEPLINRAKDDSTASRRQVFRHLRNKEAVKELFGDIASRVGDRPGGYTRVVKLGLRQGDAAELAIIELVDYNDVQPEGGSKRTRRTRRSSGRSRSKGASQQAAAAAAVETAEVAEEVVETVEAEAPAVEDAPAAETVEEAAAESVEVEAPADETPEAEAAAEAPAEEAPEAEAATEAADDLTTVWGIGPVFAGALNDAGITTFAQLAEADLDTLRNAIAEGSNMSDAAANEESWAEQAGFLAAGDADAHASYVEKLKEAAAAAKQAAEEGAADDDSDDADKKEDKPE